MLFHFVIAAVAVSVECLLGDTSAETVSSHEEPIARGRTSNIANITNQPLLPYILQITAILSRVDSWRQIQAIITTTTPTRPMLPTTRSKNNSDHQRDQKSRSQGQ